jgi:uronate dehydrogenase
MTPYDAQMRKPKLLVTGAAGRIGRAFASNTADHFDLTLTDRRANSGNFTSPIHALDITDFSACIKACDGIDLVLHLAADPSPSANFINSLLSTNIVGTYNVFTAAAQVGCQRVVFASSAQAVEGYPLDLQITESMAPRPKNLYGVTKAFGEALASQVAVETTMTCVAVRIANVAEFVFGEKHSARDVAAFISERDVVHLLERSLLADIQGFHVFHGVSNNRYKRLAIHETMRLCQYEPNDDAFKILGYDDIDHIQTITNTN